MSLRSYDHRQNLAYPARDTYRRVIVFNYQDNKSASLTRVSYLLPADLFGFTTLKSFWEDLQQRGKNQEQRHYIESQCPMADFLSTDGRIQPSLVFQISPAHVPHLGKAISAFLKLNDDSSIEKAIKQHTLKKNNLVCGQFHDSAHTGGLLLKWNNKADYSQDHCMTTANAEIAPSAFLSTLFKDNKIANFTLPTAELSKIEAAAFHLR